MNAYYHPANRAINISVWLAIGIAVGVASVWSLRGLSNPGAETLTQSAKRVPPVMYTSYVLLGVDALAKAVPNIEAVWLVVLASDHSTVELIGLPPASFRDKYNPETGLRATAIEPYLRGSFGGALVFEHEAIAEFANRLGGVWLAGKQVSGAELLNFVDGADQNQPDDALTRQAAALQGVLAQMAVAGTRVNYVSLFDCANLRSVDRDALFSILGQYYPVKTNKVRVRLADDQ